MGPSQQTPLTQVCPGGQQTPLQQGPSQQTPPQQLPPSAQHTPLQQVPAQHTPQQQEPSQQAASHPLQQSPVTEYGGQLQPQPATVRPAPGSLMISEPSSVT